MNSVRIGTQSIPNLIPCRHTVVALYFTVNTLTKYLLSNYTVATQAQSNNGKTVDTQSYVLALNFLYGMETSQLAQ